jgi:hypothetical protein
VTKAEEIALQKKWDEILRKEGLGMSRGRLGGKLTYVGTPMDLADLSDVTQAPKPSDEDSDHVSPTD